MRSVCLRRARRIAANARMPFTSFAGALLAATFVCACGGSSKPAKTATSSAPASITSSSTTSSQAIGKATSAQSPPTSTTKTANATSTAVTSTLLSPGVERASSGAITATMHATTHKPHANAAWPVHFTVTNGGAPVKATVSYEFVLDENVVAKRDHYKFTGHFSDIIRWPAASANLPLTFRAVIVAAGKTLYLDYPVQVVS